MCGYVYSKAVINLKEKILLLMESYLEIITNQDILNVEKLKDYLVDIKFLEEIVQQPNIVNDYKCIFDCTQNKQIFNFVSTKGIKLKDEFEYIKMSEQIFLEGTQAQHFITTFNQLSFLPQEIQDKKKILLEEIINKKEFLKKFLVKTHNYEDVSRALETGIEYEVQNKKYVIIKKIPENVESNVEYIVNSDIPIIKDIIEIMQYIKN